mmetsp:Transcript_64104/g.101709  ORF Transcript_64104/g.101709 Transcript_64104/m.101709 type:complete len:222 (-) Transcript_64104:52-717(-)
MRRHAIASSDFHPLVVDHVLGMCINDSFNRLRICKLHKREASRCAIGEPLNIHMFDLTKFRKMSCDAVILSSFSKATNKHDIYVVFLLLANLLLRIRYFLQIFFGCIYRHTPSSCYIATANGGHVLHLTQRHWRARDEHSAAHHATHLHTTHLHTCHRHISTATHRHAAHLHSWHRLLHSAHWHGTTHGHAHRHISTASHGHHGGTSAWPSTAAPKGSSRG